MKVRGNFVDNQGKPLSAQLPALAAGPGIRIILRFSGGGASLKEPRHLDWGAHSN
ncbi:MAG: hypothetical protein LBU25_11355 [Treponema sp.]|nr:hypothetical protein [Treponema sp.]